MYCSHSGDVSTGCLCTVVTVVMSPLDVCTAEVMVVMSPLDVCVLLKSQW